jgi:hypothetical protein
VMPRLYRDDFRKARHDKRLAGLSFVPSVNGRAARARVCETRTRPPHPGPAPKVTEPDEWDDIQYRTKVKGARPAANAR